MEIRVLRLDNERSLLRKLRARFASVDFIRQDPSDASELEEGVEDLIVIDTVKGIDRVTLFEELEEISPAKALQGSGEIMTLRMLLRLGTIHSVRLIAIPEDYAEDDAFEEICQIIDALM